MIGILDSGSGGLTVLRAIRTAVASSSVVYVGDIAHAPYGLRTPGELSALTVNSINVLYLHGARTIVSACNSVSASLVLSVFDIMRIDPANVFEMVGPTVSAFRGTNARVLVCATLATVSSGMYQNAFRMIGISVDGVAIPDLAGFIEFGASKEEIRLSIVTAFSTYDLHAYDVLVLACTHYPLVLDIFRELVPPHMIVFDPAHAVARRIEERCWPQEVGDGTTRFLISADSSVFRQRVADLLPNGQYTIEVIEDLC